MYESNVTAVLSSSASKLLAPGMRVGIACLLCW
jgi:DNA-binding transcriptional MocR family regulator